MKILGIDPGYDRIGVAVIETEKDRATLVFSTCITTDKKSPLSARLKEIGEEVAIVIQKYHPDLLAVETLYMTKNQKTAIGVAEARGVVLYEGEKARMKLVELTPLQIKESVTGYGKADKEAVFRMTSRLVTIEKKKMLDDEMDAIAIALAGSTRKKG